MYGASSEYSATNSTTAIPPTLDRLPIDRGDDEEFIQSSCCTGETIIATDPAEKWQIAAAKKSASSTTKSNHHGSP
jgi:hypothetical protein